MFYVLFIALPVGVFVCFAKFYYDRRNYKMLQGNASGQMMLIIAIRFNYLVIIPLNIMIFAFIPTLVKVSSAKRISKLQSSSQNSIVWKTSTHPQLGNVK